MGGRIVGKVGGGRKVPRYRDRLSHCVGVVIGSMCCPEENPAVVTIQGKVSRISD